MTWRYRQAGDGDEAQAAMATQGLDIFTAERGSQQAGFVYLVRIPLARDSMRASKHNS